MHMAGILGQESSTPVLKGWGAAASRCHPGPIHVHQMMEFDESDLWSSSPESCCPHDLTKVCWDKDTSKIVERQLLRTGFQDPWHRHNAT